jgi:hypothetical protein
MEAAAALIGASPRELSQRVRSGEALVDIAAKAGIGSADLKAVMTEAITATASSLVSEHMVAGLEDEINAKGVAAAGPPPKRPPAPGPEPNERLYSLASSLDMDPEQVIVSIEDGSFRQLLADKGVQAGLGILVNFKL